MGLREPKQTQTGEIVVAVLDRPWRASLIKEIRAAGAGTRLLLDCDVAGGINAVLAETRIGRCVGTGGGPESVVTSSAIKALGGSFEGKLAPIRAAEHERGLAAGLSLDCICGADNLVGGSNILFIATGVTEGSLVDGVRRQGPIIRTESIALRSRSGTVQRIVSDHLADRWLQERDRRLWFWPTADGCRMTWTSPQRRPAEWARSSNGRSGLAPK